ncbi:MAG TPA: hypothetical protein D7I06_01905 [Candidatus Poseidoniales archaeon]|nr:MAG TPA: hypothetical protein D7I06_01905 [Candidatus Poseidoniales archaeon]HII62340.1 hypothetical protein [Candidatus Poseidoniaceae archaeon]
MEFDESDLPSVSLALRNLLRGHNISIPDPQYRLYEKYPDEFRQFFSLLGLDLVEHDFGDLIYLQDPARNEELTLSTQLCTIFVVSVQLISQKDPTKPVSIFNLIQSADGFDLLRMLNPSLLEPLHLQAFLDVKLDNEIKLRKVLDKLTRLGFFKVTESGTYRFTRACLRLNDLVERLAENEESHLQSTILDLNSAMTSEEE